ncbi:hypothetical protein [Pseudoalteromonas maricaloris]|uniref:hypothetical protein n=1 Tax=Pseudoalteromonas maricaloris TaxID=184924 RepID=UPI00029B4EC4|nr:hypothetical protein [Pseudoalteromonas flavipulchra]
MNIKKSLIFSLIGAALLNVDIDAYELSNSNSLSVGFKSAYAIERIQVNGVAIPKSRFRHSVSNLSRTFETLGDRYGYDNSSSEQREKEARAFDREVRWLCGNYADQKPDSCDPLLKPTISVDGCSSEIGSIDILNSWDGVFRDSCNSHDKCYSTLDSGQKNCDDQFHADMAATCKVKWEKSAKGKKI